MSRVVDVVVTYLERRAESPEPGARSQAASPEPKAYSGNGKLLPSQVELRREQPPLAARMAAAMYHAVGADWQWLDRRAWTEASWRDAIHREGVELWTARIGDATIGYFELHAEGDAVDIRYFGLTPEFTGRGIGGPLLSAAIQRASSMGSGRVTVNTCTLDHPAALPNYLACGFRVVRTETQRRTLPE